MQTELRKPDTITIEAAAEGTLSANAADIFVTVRGSSFVSGDAALKQAKELSKLVDDLAARGLPATNVTIEGVYVETSSGMLTKSSSATYRLRIRCEKLDLFGDVLLTIAAQKAAELTRVDWRYGDEENRRAEWLDAAIRTARAKADRIAAGLGVRIVGVYDFKDAYSDDDATTPFPFGAPQAAGIPRAKGVFQSPPPAGLSLGHVKRIAVTVRVEYRVAEMSS